MAKAEGGGSKVPGFLQRPARCLRFTFFAILKCLTPSIHSYFLWSSVLYIGCSLVIFVGSMGVVRFLCKIEPRYDEVTGTGVGCGNCSADIILCDKPGICFQAGANITYMLEVVKRVDLKKAFAQAATDVVCIATVKQFDTPLEVVQALKVMVEANGYATSASSTTVTQGCKDWLCGILKHSVGATGASADLASSDGNCSDKNSAKRAPALGGPKYCPCQAQRDLVEADETLAIQTFCHFSFANITTTITTTSSVTAGAGASSRRVADLPADDEGLDDVALAFAEGIVASAEADPVAYADTLLLGGRAAEDDPEDLSWPASISDWLGLIPAPAPPWQPSPPGRDCMGAAGSGEPASGDCPEGRLLQDAAAPAPPPTITDDDRDDWKEGDWSKCQCYQACISGVRERLIECLSTKCKEKKPVAVEACECDQCSNCQVHLNLIVISAAYVIQGVVAFLVFTSFVFLEGLENDKREDKLVRLSCPLRLLGFLCKQLPPLVRVLMMANLFQLTFVMIQAWLPTSVVDFSGDCKESPELGLVSMTGSVIWLFQLIMGRVAKRTTRMPAYLFTPPRDGGMPGLKQFKQLLRALGP